MTDVPEIAAAAAARAAKQRLRGELLSARRARPSDRLTAARAAVAEAVLMRAVARSWRCVAAYEPMRTEPGSIELLTGLAGLGVRVLVPVTLPDRDLDWVRWEPTAGAPNRLGVDAIGAADAVLVPALGVALDGTRLGRGGGSYDRALARSTPGAERIALLFDGEVLDSVPAQEWDEPVGAVVTPSGHRPLGNTGVAPQR